MTLISLHLPKTGGTSFKASLQTHFGESYRDDYNDGGISAPARARHEAAVSAGEVIANQGLDGIDCVHGHFLPAKYLPLGSRRDLTFVTWMREPVTRLLSHYAYWQESYDEATALPHHRQVIEENWTLEEFCLSERFRNIYTQYLWDFPLERFAFIGISEHYQEEMIEFSERFLSIHLPINYLNPTNYIIPRNGLDDQFLRRVSDFHAADVQLYQRALQRRQDRHRGEWLKSPLGTAQKTFDEA